MPFAEDDVLSVLRNNGRNAETRLLRRWEKYVSYMLRKAQIDFNGYNFDSANASFSKLWEHQEAILKQLQLFSANDDKSLKDEPTASIVGTLAQSYAYNGDLDSAIDYFEMSRECAMRSSSQTDSFLLTIYQRKNDVEKMRECFVAQVGKTPEEYYKAKDFSDIWKLISYCRLRATDLYVNKSTNLKSEELYVTLANKGEYPLPLAQKWEAIALFFEDKETNRNKVEGLFTLAIESLIAESNGFTIRTLVLPIIQCYGFVNPRNKFHSSYNQFIENTLLRESDAFRIYVTNKAQRLLTIKNERDFTLWERALMLPFIYS
jgi:tetratricopeptide (TPR) repeat protein